MSIRYDIIAALESADAYGEFKARLERSAAYHAAKRERQTIRRAARTSSPRVQAQAAFQAEAR